MDGLEGREHGESRERDKTLGCIRVGGGRGGELGGIVKQ